MSSTSDKRLLIINVAGLGYELLRQNNAIEWQDLVFQPLESVFPAVTCTVQAGFRTASEPNEHGMIANGIYMKALNRPMFWEQSATLVKGPRIWDSFRRQGGRVGMIFWQQSLGEEVDLLLSPAPVHKHGGGMIDDCYGQPADLYPRLCRAVGRPFRLRHYWGPMAGAKAGEWIASATTALMNEDDLAPELLLTYFPSLDYDLQRYGRDSKRGRKALQITLGQLTRLFSSAQQRGYEILIFGDYEIGPITQGAEFPNRALAEKGLLKLRKVGQKTYPDLYTSRAFAMVDHELAHVYVKNPLDLERVKKIMTEMPGVGRVMDRQEQAKKNLNHPQTGNLVLVAGEGYWFAYPWWCNKAAAPDYAGHVDIHNKPGFDPGELFFGWPPWSVSQNTNRVCGSHGKNGKNRRVCYTSTLTFNNRPATIIELAKTVETWLAPKELL